MSRFVALVLSLASLALLSAGLCWLTYAVMQKFAAYRRRVVFQREMEIRERQALQREADARMEERLRGKYRPNGG